jgi:hypothetical protein
MPGSSHRASGSDRQLRGGANRKANVSSGSISGLQRPLSWRNSRGSGGSACGHTSLDNRVAVAGPSSCPAWAVVVWCWLRMHTWATVAEVRSWADQHSRSGRSRPGTIGQQRTSKPAWSVEIGNRGSQIRSGHSKQYLTVLSNPELHARPSGVTLETGGGTTRRSWRA